MFSGRWGEVEANKTVTRNLFWGCFLPSLSLLFPSLSQLRSGPSNLAGRERHLQLPDWVLNTPKMRLRPRPSYKRILVYLEPRERVWKLRMSSYFC